MRIETIRRLLRSYLQVILLLLITHASHPIAFRSPATTLSSSDSLVDLHPAHIDGKQRDILSKYPVMSAFVIILGGSKRWIHFVSLYGLNSKRRLNTRQTVGCGIPISLLALRVDLRGLRSKLS